MIRAEGSESSHMHNRDDLNLNRGYEWWLMREAKKVHFGLSRAMNFTCSRSTIVLL